MVTTLSIEDLAENCQTENKRYQHSQQSNPVYCYELFRRALEEGQEAAWTAIEKQYRDLVRHWVHRYRPDDQAETDDYVYEAFARMWRYGSRPETAQKMKSLGQCLSYLKKCVWSTVEDNRRRQQHSLLLIENKDLERLGPKNDDPANKVAQADLGQQVRQILQETTQNEVEVLVAEESWVYGKMPRHIYEAYPHHFEDVQSVSQIKRNILKRLKRNPKLQALFENS